MYHHFATVRRRITRFSSVTGEGAARISATAKSTARPSCLAGVLFDIPQKESVDG